MLLEFIVRIEDDLAVVTGDWSLQWVHVDVLHRRVKVVVSE